MDKKSILKELGFEEITEKEHGAIVSYHALINRFFDFSANSIEGIVHNIYMTGRKDGEEMLQSKIKALLNIEGNS